MKSLAITCLLMFAILVGAFLWWYYHGFSFGLGISRDEQLIEIFYAHRSAFEKLQQMASEDAQYGWYFNSPYFRGAELDEKYRQEYAKDPLHAWYFTSPYFEGGKLKEARRKEYEDLVSEISPGLHIGTDYSGMCFGFAGGGSFLAIGPEWEKGIEYLPGSYETNAAVYCGELKMGDVTNPPQWHGILLTNLDDAQTLPASCYLRPIESNWFLYYNRDE